MQNLISKIDAILPQTQCTKCGFDDCNAYAVAIVSGTPHNQCPPGGDDVILKLSNLLKREILPLNPENGIHKPKIVAKVREDECIGCTKCIQACPVDAIIGAGKLMHSVIESECTGCDLCVPVCPVDCIDLIELAQQKQPENLAPNIKEQQKNYYRKRHNYRDERLEQLKLAEKIKHQQNKSIKSSNSTTSTQDKQAYIKAAILRAKAKKR